MLVEKASLPSTSHILREPSPLCQGHNRRLWVGKLALLHPLRVHSPGGSSLIASREWYWTPSQLSSPFWWSLPRTLVSSVSCCYLALGQVLPSYPAALVP